jgi:multidrug resistance protein, MATE family
MSLTKFPEGSLRELWHITFPLMLSALSVTSMTFVDRLLLAHHSTAALNAVANSMTVGWTFIVAWMVLTGISEVFVAQNNGAKKYQKLGPSVWQALWIGIGSLAFFLPLAASVDHLFFADPSRQLERDYLRWIFYFGPTFPIYCALCGFFIGQGKTRLVTVLAIATNLLNAILDYCLIFGVQGWISPLGIKGAAIATGLSSLFQMLALGAVFLSHSNRLNYGTNHWQIDLKSLQQCLKIGLPGSVFAFAEMLGWVAYYTMMTHLGERHLTVASVSQSLIIFFYFFIDAVSKGVSTIVGNLIGAQKESAIPNVLKVGARLHFIFFLLLFSFFYVYTDQILIHFLPYASPAELADIKPSLFYCLIVFSFYLFFEGIRLLFAGVLTAAGDTLFLLIGGSLSIWLLMVWPVYQLVYLKNGTIEQAVTIGLVYSLLAAIIYFYRYYKGPWRSLSIIEKPAIQSSIG